ncbi:Bcr/CflA family multidrug efflux MFS transporter [Pseudoalteromonas xiamenensis]|uniref:Bcr/CflA family efflux transporter n=1 Tax=Pseudoalteromonas xiamenensis TaxID=882626 RepID=A0A975DIM9_9GAMM|nr:Bcr/CflA family multidrug efflux MFS transporter [Pseudoalteromonas xiamenensis]QTH71840.1 Bcr/CflA family multidrug efflux MFS transporter [Pseudoalteromonas xiamenensis]
MAQKRLLPLLAAVVAITPLAIDMYLPAMLTIANELNTSMENVQISLSIYLAGYALGMLIFGPLADQHSRRTLARFGLAGFAISSALLAIVDDIAVFWALRGVQAFAGAAATVVIPGIVRHLYQEHTAKGMSYVSMIMMIAPLVAPTVGAALMVQWHWSAIFWCLSLYAVITLVLVQFKLIDIPRKPSTKRGLALFIDNYKEVLSEKNARFDILTSMLVSFGFFCFLTSVPFIYLEHFEVSEKWFGVLFAFNVIALTLGNFINTRVVTRFGSRKMLYISLAFGLCSAICLNLVSFFDLGLYPTALTIAPVMMALGVIASNADALILIAFEHKSGTATAVIGTLRFGSGALVGPLLAFIQPQDARAFSLMMLSALVLTLACQWKQKSTL